MRSEFERWVCACAFLVAILLLVSASEEPNYPSPNPRVISAMHMAAQLVDSLGERRY